MDNLYTNRDIVLFILLLCLTPIIYIADPLIILVINSYMRTRILDVFFIYFTTYGNYVLALVYGLVILAWRNKKELRRWIPIILVAYASWLLSDRFVFALKNIFRRPRPHQQLGLRPLCWAGGYSFPSGHSQTAWSLITPIYLETNNKVLKVALLSFGILMAFSRMYCLVHFATDVMWGSYIGYLFGKVLYWVYSGKKTH